VLYAANLERVSRAPLRLARQWPDREIPVEVLEDLETRTLRVVPKQGVEVFEPRSNPARRRPREIQAGVRTPRARPAQDGVLKRGLDRLELGSHGERVAAGQEADEIPGLAFQAKDLRLQLSRPVVVHARGGIDLGVHRKRQRIDDWRSHRLPELSDERAFEPILAVPDAMS
jgi:hypothetical protein